MHFVDPRREAGRGAQTLVDLTDFRRNHEKLLRHLFRRIGRCCRDPASVGIILGVNGVARRHSENRGLPLAQQRSHGPFRPPTVRADAPGQPDRHVDGDDGGLFRLGRNIAESSDDAHPKVVAVGVGQCHDPSGFASVRPGEPGHELPVCRLAETGAWLASVPMIRD
jgi:hypothetical protein